MELLKFLAYHGLIKNKMKCENYQKKTGGGVSKIVKMEDGTELNVNTNKCEGLFSKPKTNLLNKTFETRHLHIFRCFNKLLK